MTAPEPPDSVWARSVLDGIDARIRSTPEERARVERSMWDRFDEAVRSPPVVAGTDGSPHEERDARLAGTAEIIQLQLEPHEPAPRRRVPAALAAVALVVALAVAVLFVGETDDNTGVEAIGGTTPSSAPIATPTRITSAQMGAQLPTGRHVIDLGGTRIVFDTASRATIATLTEDRLVLTTGPERQGVATTVTIALADPVFAVAEAPSWFESVGARADDLGRLMQGRPAEEWQISLQRPDCAAYEPCVDAAEGAGGDPVQLMDGGANRLLVLERPGQRSLLVLATFESNPSGEALTAYTTIVDSLSIEP